MKKLFAILTVAIITTACNNAAETTTVYSKDLISMAAEAQKIADSATAAIKLTADTMTNKMVEGVKDTAGKAVEKLKKK